MKTKLERLLNSFEKDTDEDGKVNWMYYGDVDPKEAAQDLARITAQLDAAMKLLKSYEWVRDGMCPECFEDITDGHAKECKLMDMLKQSS